MARNYWLAFPLELRGHYARRLLGVQTYALASLLKDFCDEGHFGDGFGITKWRPRPQSKVDIAWQSFPNGAGGPCKMAVSPNSNW